MSDDQPKSPQESADEEEEVRSSSRGWLIKSVAIVGVLAMISVSLYVVFDGQRSQTRQADQLRPLQNLAATFPAPSGFEVAFPDTTQPNPPTAVRGWRMSDGTELDIDGACGQWRDAYRGWLGAEGQETVSGESVPGQSCSLSAIKDSYQVDLVMAVYGSAVPQATLAVTEPQS